MKVYEIVTDRIIAALENGVIPWRKEWSGAAQDGRMPSNASTGKPYRGINVLTLWATQAERGYSSSQWLTFNQARAMGGCVRKGEKATPIVFWKFDRKQDADTGEDRSYAFARYYSVFNLAQIDGLPEAPAAPDAPAFTPLESAEIIAGRYLSCANAPALVHGGQDALYSPRVDRVQMPARESFRTAEGYYSTLFHELAHSTGHASRLDRFAECGAPMSFGTEDYSKEELIAEMTAAFLCAESSIANDATLSNSVAYIQAWLRRLRNDKSLVVSAAQKAQKAADYILDRKPFTEQAEESAAVAVTA